MPEAGYARKVAQNWSVGVALYGNGGLNTEFRDDTGIPETNGNPERCGDAAGNFLLGCGKLGFDLAQIIVAPTLSWQYTEGQSFGLSALIGYQRIKVYGFQALENISAHPEAVSNRGNDDAFGAGVRLGWFGRLLPWLDIGAAYSSRMYFQKFDRYRGLIADGGGFDIPQNIALGIAIRPARDWEVGLDIQRVFWGDIRALSNGVLNSLQDPENKPFGSKDGSGFNWVDRNSYRAGASYAVTPRLTLRAGATYGKRPVADSDSNSVTLNLFAPNPEWQVTAGERGHAIHAISCIWLLATTWKKSSGSVRDRCHRSWRCRNLEALCHHLDVGLESQVVVRNPGASVNSVSAIEGQNRQVNPALTYRYRP